MKKRVRWIVAGALAAVAIGWFVVRPMIVRSVVEGRLAEQLGTRVELDGASYAFGSSASLSGLRVYHPQRDELIVEIDAIDAEFDGSLDRIAALRIDGVRAHAVREDDGRWNFEALKTPSDGSLWIGSTEVRGIRADFARRGLAERFDARVDRVTVVPGSAFISGLALDWGTDPVARVPSTRVRGSLDLIEEVVIEDPRIWAGLTPMGRPELRERLKSILGESGRFDRVFIKHVRVLGGTVLGVMRTPDGLSWEIPIESVHGRLDWTEPAVFDIPTFEGKLCDGVIGASATIRLDEAGESVFQGSLDRIDMEKLAATTRFSKCRVRGSLSGFLDGRLKPTGDVIGTGKLKAREAQIWELPVFKSVLSGLGVKVPRESKFSLMQADVVLSGDRFQFVDLKTEGGDTLDVRGEGQMLFNGTGLLVHFWPRPINNSDVPLIGELSEFFGGAAVTVKVNGTIVDPRTQVVEGVVDLFP